MPWNAKDVHCTVLVVRRSSNDLYNHRLLLKPPTFTKVNDQIMLYSYTIYTHNWLFHNYNLFIPWQMKVRFLRALKSNLHKAREWLTARINFCNMILLMKACCNSFKSYISVFIDIVRCSLQNRSCRFPRDMWIPSRWKYLLYQWPIILCFPLPLQFFRKIIMKALQSSLDILYVCSMLEELTRKQRASADSRSIFYRSYSSVYRPGKQLFGRPIA